MNVDWLDDETIFYLDGDDLVELINGSNVWIRKEKDEFGKEKEVMDFTVQLHTSSKTTPGRYDDCLLALEEAVAFINAAQELGVTDGIDTHFDLRKVVRTYEYHKEIQQEYQK